ncbi:aminotransferase class I/II-fold pyridoxal phosphate-dependent enzyme [candidate division KSB1 bacterium]|nr:aminotransferase class I/II-fold pyridoxal phosphate-dependent enzyme [candidate division KSB1 bacterium]
MTTKRKPATLAIHGTESRRGKNEPVSPPMYHSSTYVLQDSETVEAAMSPGSDKRYIYQRYGNPSQDLLEKRMALLEEAEDSMFFASGMAAITTAVLSVMNAGDEVLSIPALYGQTLNFFKKELAKFSMSARFVAIDELYDLKNIVSGKTKLIYFETPANPNMQVVDIERVVEQAKKFGLKTMIDNTYASPINQRPIPLGTDYVVHSATKYLGGHSDVLAGVIVGDKNFIDTCRKRSHMYGPVIDPFNVFLLLRSMSTLEVRVKRQNENALKLAEALKKHPNVEVVNYPGLPDDPYHETAKKQMDGFGGMIAVDVKGGKKEAMKVADSFEVILNAVSLGGVETLASIPVITSHIWLSPDELKEAKVTPSMIRISVGLEDPDDLIEDFNQALDKI